LLDTIFDKVLVKPAQLLIMILVKDELFGKGGFQCSGAFIAAA
jgi:hypothetical protein